MSLITLTKDLVNFKWTNYNNVGDNLSQTGGRHGGTLPGGQPPHSTDHSEFDDGAGTPQSFYDGHSSVVTGQKTFERPNPKSLDQMVSKFGPLNTQPNDRGPYGVSDFMDGTKQGRGFTPPGGHPLGFTVDMGVSEYVIGTTGYTLTPLSHTIAGITSNGPHGSVSEHTIDIQFGTSWSNPEAVNAWAEDFMTTPLANYVSQYSEPVDSLTHEVTMIALTGPTAPDDYQTNINVTPKVDNAHGSDFMTLPISGYPGLYVGSQGDIVPIIPSVIGLGESDSIAATWPDKIFHQLGNLQDEKLYDVYKHHFLPTIENFNHISLLTDLFENESTSVAAEKWKDGSVHIGTQDWAAPVGGGVTSWANLMAVTPRYSMFRDAQGNYQVPTLFPHEWTNQPTFNVLGGYPENTYGEGYTINSQFGFSWNNIAGWFMASDGGVATNYSSQHGAHSFEIGDINIDLYESMPLYHLDTPLTIKWHSIGEQTAGLWPYKQFGFSRGGFEEGFLDIETSTGALVYATQPFIRRQVGQGYLDGRSTWVVGVDHLATVIARIEEDTMRISSWLNTPAGKNWTGNQYTLQELNPRPETRIYNPLSLITSLVPHFHGQRHLSGFFGIFGPGKYGDLQTDMDYQEEGPGWDGKDTAGIWGYGTREAGSFAIAEKNRLTGLTAQFIGGVEPKQWPHLFNLFPSWDGGFWSAISGMENWSATNRGRTPEKPTQVVFSQKGAYGQGPIHKNIGNFEGDDDPTREDWSTAGLSWLNTNLEAPGIAEKLLRPTQYYRTDNYGALDPKNAYITRFGKWHSPLVHGWAYLDPTGFDASDVRYKDTSTKSSDKLIYPTGIGESKRPEPGTISWTIGKDSHYNDDVLQDIITYRTEGVSENIRPLARDEVESLAAATTGLGWLQRNLLATDPKASSPTYDLNKWFRTKPYSDLGPEKSYGTSYGQWHSGLVMGWAYLDPVGFNKININYRDGSSAGPWTPSWARFDTSTGFELKGRNLLYMEGIGSRPTITNTISWTIGDNGTAYSANNFLGSLSDTSHDALTALGQTPTAREEAKEHLPIAKSLTQLYGRNGIPIWSFGTKDGVSSPKPAPRSSPDYLTLSYSKLDWETSAYLPFVSWLTYRNIPDLDNDFVAGVGTPPQKRMQPHSDIINFSWRFFEPESIRASEYWGMVRPTDIEVNESLKDTVFTINDKQANKSAANANADRGLIYKYSTLSYGHIPGSHMNKFKAKLGNEGQPGGSGTDIHDQLNYEKTLRSPGELNTEEVANPNGGGVVTKRPDWLEALSSKDGRGAPDGFGIRDKAKKIVDDIGQPGQNNVPIVKDDTLGVIKKGLDSENYKNDQTDKVNLTPYGSKEHGNKGQPDGATDFIKFKFRDITNNKFIIFRALLSGISDSITPEWTGTRYIGRPDQVYVYQGAERKVSFSFDIYPKTKQELPVLWEKINYLVGLCYPSYVSNRMIAPFIELTIGDMFVNTPGFLDSLSVEVNDQGTWEIENGLQLPKHITCQCSFTYVGKYIQAQKGKHYELGWLPDSLTSDKSIGRQHINFNDWPDRENTGLGFNKITPLFKELGQ